MRCEMRTIELAAIRGIHPDFARIEQELDLAPFDLPDAALVPLGIAAQISQLYPLVVAGADLLCVGQTTLYRWLSVYAAPETPICCIDLPRNFTKARLIQLVLAERLVAPALARITPQQVRDLYQHIKHAEQWPHAYRSHAHLAQLVGIKPLKGSEGRE
jgi:hypothetical protein